MNFEQPNNTEQLPDRDDSPWGEAYQKDLPPFNPDQKNTETIEPQISDEELATFASDRLEQTIREKTIDLQQGDFDKWAGVASADELRDSLEQDRQELEVWDEVTNALDGSRSIPEILASLKNKYEQHGKQIAGERGQQYREKAQTISSILSNDNNSRGYNFWMHLATEDRARNTSTQETTPESRTIDLSPEPSADELRRAKLEASLNETINIEALISDGDAQLAQKARKIDNSTFATPGQEEAASKRLEQAMRDYRQAKAFHDAESKVLEEIQDFDRSSYSQEELIERLREYQHNIRHSQNGGDRKSWAQLSQACNRIIARLEKFTPDLADNLNRKDWDYWNKITGAAQPVAAEDLAPKTLSRSELTGPISSDAESDAGMQMEDVDNGKTPEQINTEESRKMRRLEEASQQEDEIERQRRIAEQKQNLENERILQERQAAEAKRQKMLREQRERVLRAVRGENISQTNEQELEEDNEITM